MKKYFSILMSAVMLLLASCTQDDLSNLPLGQEMNTKVSMQLPAIQRATHSDPAVSGMRVYLIVSQNNQIIKVDSLESVSQNPITFNVRLVSGQVYDIAAWADFGADYYTVSAAEGKVSMKLGEGNTITGSDNKRDAYFAILNGYTLTDESIGMTLKRPFGLINIKTLDYADPAVLNTQSLPTNYATTIKMPTAFNLLSGETMGDAEAVNISAPVLSNWAEAGVTGELSYDYIFASANKELIGFTMNYTKDNDEPLVSYEFTDIPLQRNYKTNISGNILTKQGTVSVSIDQAWEGESSQGVLASALQKLLNEVPTNTASEVVITLSEAIKAGDLAEDKLYFPATDKNITLVVPDIETAITIEEAADAQYIGKFTLQLTDADANAENVVINLPNATVGVEAGAFGTLAATTAENTLVIGEGASVGSLTIEGGNVKIFGDVTTIQNNAIDNTITWYVGNAERLVDVLQKIGDVIILSADIQNLSSDIALVREGLLFDGNGFAMNKNIKVQANNITIKNLTINSTSGDAIYTETSDITLNIEGVKVMKTGGATCIRVSDAEGVTLNVKDCNLVITKNSMRGINFYDLIEGEKCYANVENTHIGPREETMGYGDYNDEQNAVFKGLSDTRGIGVGGNVSGLEINLKNSVVEGIFYAVNVIPAAGSVDVNIENSTLDGRCAFNLWGRNENGTNLFNVKSSKLVGRNPFGGPTESFATIVFNFGQASGFSEPKNNHVIVEDSEIYCYNNPETPTNEQLAADMRSWDTNTLDLKGNTVIYDRSASSRLEYAVDWATSDNTCNVDQTVRFVDRDGNPKNKPIVKP